MVKEFPDKRGIFEEDPQEAPPGWAQVQAKLAGNGGLSLLLVEGFQPPALVISNNNSICRAIQSSPDHADLCAPFCGEAHQRAREAGTVTNYRCHAGLHCFVAPVEIGEKNDLAVIGGRAFLEIADYKKAIERFRSGDLRKLFTEQTFVNVIFGTAGRLDELARRLTRTVRDYNAAVSEAPITEEKDTPEETSAAALPNLEREIARLRNQIEHQAKFANSLQYFLEQISSTKPAETYCAVLMNSKDLLQAERASLLVYDETTDQLTVKAAIGIPTDIADVSSMRLGEGISGEALEAGRPLMVA